MNLMEKRSTFTTTNKTKLIILGQKSLNPLGIKKENTSVLIPPTHHVS